MSNSKKIISLLLSVIMIMSVFTIVPFTAGAAEADTAETGAESGTTGDCTWTLNNGVLTISGNGEMGDYNSVWQYDAYVTTAPWGAYVTTAPWGGYSFNTVVIENGVTSIGGYAFYGCKQLTSVTISSSVTSISSYAFNRCTGLMSIMVAEGNTVYDSRNDCNAIVKTESNELIYCCKNTVIPDSVTSIGYRAFYGCTSLTSVTIPDSVTSIGWYAFEDCTGLKSVTIPDSVTSIGGSAFSDTAWYDDQPDGIVYAGKVAYDIKGTCPSEVVIKDGTLGIADSAFRGCTGLTSVTIPDSVTSIGRSAFYGCTSLTSVTIGNSVTSIGYDAFEDTAWYNNQPDGLVYAGKVAYKMKGTCPAEIVIKDGTLGIADSAFSDCTSLTSVTIPDSVTSISRTAFYGCTGLTSVTLSQYAVNSFYSLFNDSYRTIENIVLSDSVTSIGGEAFYDCTGLTSVTIGSSVTSIGGYAFWGCSSLTSVTIPDSVTSIGNFAFSWCEGLTSVTIPDSVTSIGISAFFGCTGIKSVTLNQTGVDSFSYSFVNCNNLGTVILKDSVTSIGDFAFDGCTGLTSVTIPDSVTSIGSSAFDGCTGLIGVTIPDSVTSIGFRAFSNCTGLTSITVPDSVTSIDGYAFGYNYDKTTWKHKKVDDFTIYGYKGSMAERYANNNGFTFITLDEAQEQTLTDDSTDISVTLNDDAELSVSEVTDSAVIGKYALDSSEKAARVFDIALIKDGSAVQPSGEVTVKIPCDNKDAKIYRAESDNSLTDMKAVYKDGYMVFTTDHFSVYILAVPQSALLGDVDGNGEADAIDSTIIQRYATMISVPYDEEQLIAGDVDGDGSLTIVDATFIQRYVTHVVTPYAIGEPIG